MSDKLARAKHRGIDKTSLPKAAHTKIDGLPKPRHMSEDNAAYRGIHAGTARLDKIPLTDEQIRLMEQHALNNKDHARQTKQDALASDRQARPTGQDALAKSNIDSSKDHRFPEAKPTTVKGALSAQINPQAQGDAGIEADTQTNKQLKSQDAKEGYKKKSIDVSTLLISICNIGSRVTGFIRTWAMAAAIGTTLLSSSYQVANNLPNMLYELVAGGMLATAFLPVYLSIKQKLGKEAGNDYASNLLSIVTVFLAIITLLCLMFPSFIIFTQSFMSDQADQAYSVFFFQFFAIQILFYGIGAIFTGLLNANRDYLWSFAAPIFNNVIVITSFILYIVIAPSNSELALYIIAIGNTLGVFIQMVIQIPALKRNGIRLRFHINFKDPALKETLSIGIPAIIIMASAFVIVSVQNAASYSFTESGPSIISYSRLWFTLAYAVLVVPITTTLFTEISEMYAKNNMTEVKKTIIAGTNQIFFFMIPFMLYLIVYSIPLISLFQVGAFTQESTYATASYLAAFALALPCYGVNTHLQKVFSSLRILKSFAIINIFAALIQVALTAGAALLAKDGVVNLGIESIAYASMVFYVLADILLFLYLRKKVGSLNLKSVAKACINSFLLGLAGAGLGAALFWVLDTFLISATGSLALNLVYVVICGVLSLVVTYGLAIKFKLAETAIIIPLLTRIKIIKTPK